MGFVVRHRFRAAGREQANRFGDEVGCGGEGVDTGPIEGGTGQDVLAFDGPIPDQEGRSGAEVGADVRVDDGGSLGRPGTKSLR